MDTQSIPLDSQNASVIPLDPFDAFKAIEGRAFSEYRCWDVANYLLSQRYQTDITALLDDQTSPFVAAEIWFKAQTDLPETLVQPWDICFFAINRIAVDHVGIILSREYFATAREEAGVVKERFSLWTAHLLQVARITPRVLYA